MKKLWMLAAVALVALTAFVSPSEAGRWRTDEIKWTLTSQGGITSTGQTVAATAINQRDTAFAALGATDDTTGSFNLTDADPFLYGDAGADTMCIGYLVLVSDTTATVAQTTTNMTVAFQGLPQGTTHTVANATTIGTSICVATSGDRAFVFPLRIAQRGFSGANLDYLPMMAALQNCSARAITTTVIGGGVAMARAYWIYWDNDD